jgi:hypothetical protein
MLDRIQVLMCQNLGLKVKVLCKVEPNLHIAEARCQSLRLICQLGRYKLIKFIEELQTLERTCGTLILESLIDETCQLVKSLNHIHLTYKLKGHINRFHTHL